VKDTSPAVSQKLKLAIDGSSTIEINENVTMEIRYE
jgi:hypothetical protein